MSDEHTFHLSPGMTCRMELVHQWQKIRSELPNNEAPNSIVRFVHDQCVTEAEKAVLAIALIVADFYALRESGEEIFPEKQFQKYQNLLNREGIPLDQNLLFEKLIQAEWLTTPHSISQESMEIRFPDQVDFIRRHYCQYTPERTSRSFPNAITPKRGESTNTLELSSHQFGEIISLSEDYRILSHLGSGGQKHVFEVEQQSIGRTVALKEFQLPCHLSNDADHLRMLREVQLQAKLDHQGIPVIFSLSRSQKGVSTFVERKITGVSWSELLDSNSLDTNLDILLDVSRIVAFAHREHQIIHGDLKPSNVMIDREYRQTYVVDWGLAISLCPTSPSDAADETDFYLGGTQTYMPPEATQGRRSALSTATDVFMLGGILYRILTGKAPYDEAYYFRREDIYTEIESCHIPPIQPVDPKVRIPNELIQITYKALAKEPRQRFSDAGAFADALERYRRRSDILEQLEQASQRLEQIRSTMGILDERKVLPVSSSDSLKLLDVANDFRNIRDQLTTIDSIDPPNDHSDDSDHTTVNITQVDYFPRSPLSDETFHALSLELDAREMLTRLSLAFHDFGLANTQLETTREILDQYDSLFSSQSRLEGAVSIEETASIETTTFAEKAVLPTVVLTDEIVASSNISPNVSHTENPSPSTDVSEVLESSYVPFQHILRSKRITYETSLKTLQRALVIQRRDRRMKWLVVATIMMLLILGIVTLFYRNRAGEAIIQAEQNRVKAAESHNSELKARERAVLANMERQRQHIQRIESTRSMANRLLFDYAQTLGKLPGTTLLQYQVVAQAKQMLEEQEEDPIAREQPNFLSDLAVAWLQLGDIQGYPHRGNLGEYEDAKRCYHRSLKLFQEASEQKPLTNGERLTIARVWLHLAINLQTTTVDPLQLRQYLEKSIQLCESLEPHDDSERMEKSRILGVAWTLQGCGELLVRKENVPILQNTSNFAMILNVVAVRRSAAAKLIKGATYCQSVLDQDPADLEMIHYWLTGAMSSAGLDAIGSVMPLFSGADDSTANITNPSNTLEALPTQQSELTQVSDEPSDVSNGSSEGVDEPSDSFSLMEHGQEMATTSDSLHDVMTNVARETAENVDSDTMDQAMDSLQESLRPIRALRAYAEQKHAECEAILAKNPLDIRAMRACGFYLSILEIWDTQDASSTFHDHGKMTRKSILFFDKLHQKDPFDFQSMVRMFQSYSSLLMELVIQVSYREGLTLSDQMVKLSSDMITMRQGYLWQQPTFLWIADRAECFCQTGLFERGLEEYQIFTDLCLAHLVQSPGNVTVIGMHMESKMDHFRVWMENCEDAKLRATYQSTQGWYHLLAGKIVPARRWFTISLKNDLHSTLSQIRMGHLWMLEGKSDAAYKTYQQLRDKSCENGLTGSQTIMRDLHILHRLQVQPDTIVTMWTRLFPEVEWDPSATPWLATEMDRDSVYQNPVVTPAFMDRIRQWERNEPYESDLPLANGIAPLPEVVRQSEYNARGKELRRTFIGKDGYPSEGKDGYAIWIKKYNAVGNVSDWFCFDANGVPCIDSTDGSHHTEFGYDDQNRTTSLKYYDEQNRPCNTDGFHELIRTYDDQNRITSRSFRDMNGHPCPCEDGYFREVRSYGDDGLSIIKSYQNEHGKRISINDGYTREIALYSDVQHNHLISTIFLYELEPHSDGYRQERWYYDDETRLRRVEFWDLEDRPVLCRDGSHGYVQARDHLGKVVERPRFGLEDQPLIQCSVITSIRAKTTQNDKGPHFQIGDVLLTCDGSSDLSSSQMSKILTAHGSHTLLVLRGTERITIQITEQPSIVLNDLYIDPMGKNEVLCERLQREAHEDMGVDPRMSQQE